MVDENLVLVCTGPGNIRDTITILNQRLWFSCAAEVSQITLYRDIGVPYHFGSTVQKRNYSLKKYLL